jgi:acyl-CoA hydrolase
MAEVGIDGGGHEHGGALPPLLRERLVGNDEALQAAVTSGTKIASGFATSEPQTFYASLWDHIQRHDLTDIDIRQALFMAPHRLLVGDALTGRGPLQTLAGRVLPTTGFGAGLRSAVRKIDGLRFLIEHFRELRERRITFVSGFMSPVTNMVIPRNVFTNLLYPEWVGRNPARMGIVHMQSVHFPDAPDALAYDDDGGLIPTLAPVVMTPPDEHGFLSHGIANGCTAQLLELALQAPGVRVLLYLNRHQPYTRGHEESPNTIHYDRFAQAARESRLWVVEDEAPLPALPADTFDTPSEAEQAIARHVVNHVEVHRDLTYGRALQVGIGTTGVLAVKGLLDSSWTGRSYTEMLEPYTYALWEAGKVAGTHFIRSDGRREPLDGKLVATFSLGVRGAGFYEKLHHNPDILLSSASRVVVSEGFYGGMGINNVLGIDFQGHVNSSARDRNPYSGIGGSAVIMRGLARGGVAYLCLKSTHRSSDGELRSSIFPFLPKGTPVSLVGPDLMGTREGARVFLATEHGVVRISGMSQDRFVRALVSVAAPEFRDWLAREAWDEYRIKV